MAEFFEEAVIPKGESNFIVQVRGSDEKKIVGHVLTGGLKEIGIERNPYLQLNIGVTGLHSPEEIKMGRFEKISIREEPKLREVFEKEIIPKIKEELRKNLNITCPCEITTKSVICTCERENLKVTDEIVKDKLEKVSKIIEELPELKIKEGVMDAKRAEELRKG